MCSTNKAIGATSIPYIIHKMLLYPLIFICLAAVIQCASATMRSFSFVSSVATRFDSRNNKGGVKSPPLSPSDDSLNILAAVLPGDPMVTGTIAQGVMNGISLYSNILLARIALSWFPQLFNQFPVLRPIITVTEPYLKAFRRTIPPIAGFDISALPAIFILDILSQTAAAVGAEFPADFDNTNKQSVLFAR